MFFNGAINTSSKNLKLNKLQFKLTIISTLKNRLFQES